MLSGKFVHAFSVGRATMAFQWLAGPYFVRHALWTDFPLIRLFYILTVNLQKS